MGLVCLKGPASVSLSYSVLPWGLTSMGSQWEVSGPQKPYLTRIQVRATEDEMIPVSGSQLAPD